LLGGFIAGTLDAAAAVVLYAKPINLHSIAGIFRYIASGLFGRGPAFSGGPVYFLAGLIIHYLIALSWTALYLLIIYRIFKPGYLWIKSILFACTVWVAMNGILLPIFGLSSAHNSAWTILKSFSPILLCVSFPVCLIVEKSQNHFKK
jgi:hypothetical protein